MSIKGRPMNVLTASERKVLNLLPLDERPKYLRLLRQRKWLFVRRQADPDKYRKASRDWKRAQTAKGYYKKGGNGYKHARSTPKRRAYWKRYNATRRKELQLMRASNACRSHGKAVSSLQGVC